MTDQTSNAPVATLLGILVLWYVAAVAAILIQVS
jgi:hypothetical protein